MKPRPEAKADALINSNMPQADTGVVIDSTAEEIVEEPDPAVLALNESLAETEAEIDAALAGG